MNRLSQDYKSAAQDYGLWDKDYIPVVALALKLVVSELDLADSKINLASILKSILMLILMRIPIPFLMPILF